MAVGSNDIYPIGVYIRSIREQRKFSREALAQVTGVSAGAIEALEMGSRDMHISNFLPLMEGLRGSYDHVACLYQMDQATAAEAQRLAHLVCQEEWDATRVSPSDAMSAKETAAAVDAYVETLQQHCGVPIAPLAAALTDVMQHCAAAETDAPLLPFEACLEMVCDDLLYLLTVPTATDVMGYELGDLRSRILRLDRGFQPLPWRWQSVPAQMRIIHDHLQVLDRLLMHILTQVHLGAGYRKE